MDKKADRADWKTTNPQYKPTPTQRHADGSISQDGGVRADQAMTIKEWYRLMGVKSYA